MMHLGTSYRVRRLPVMILLPVLLLLALAFVPGLVSVNRAQAAVQQVSLTAVADAEVSAGNPGTNYGAGPLGVTANARSFVQFDLSALPASANILSATLRMKPADIVGEGPHTIHVAVALAAWDETTLTWDNKPANSAPGTSTSVGDYGWHSWNVTSVVQQWSAGGFANHGFVLLTASPGVYFESRETLPPPTLDIAYSVDDEYNPDLPNNQPFRDLGDAPDSSNNQGQTNTAYPGTPGRFPTVYQVTPAGQPAGPRHENLGAQAILGMALTREAEADSGPDADGPTNILAGGDNANNDRGDDGWRNPSVPILDCQQSNLTVRVRKAPNATQDIMYLNAWFDGNQDGDWDDIGHCQFENGQQTRSYEWIVQDYVVDLGTIPAGTYVDINVPTVLIYNPDGNAEAQHRHWVRISLSEQKAPRNPATGLADGRGPHPGNTPPAYAFGETEDYLYRPTPQGQPGTVTLTKAVTTPRTPVGYGDTVTYTIRLKHEGGTEPIRAEIRDRLDYPQHVLPQYVDGQLKYVNVVDRSPGVNPLEARIEYRRPGGSARPDQIVRWRGTLAPDAEVELSFLVHVHPFCRPGENTVTITNTATLHKPDGTKVDEKSVAFQAACPRASLDDIEIGQEIITDDEGGQLSAARADAANIMFETVRPKWRGVISNIAEARATIGVSLNFEEIKVTAASAGPSRELCLGSFDLQPGETRTMEQPLNIIGILVSLRDEDIPADAAQEIALRSRLRYTLLPPGEPFDCNEFQLLPPEVVGEHQVQASYRPWDLGDAPDSSNHAAAGMTAYPGVPANFPTVFDVATGAPEGPRHARPRPFHLGKRVEFEPDADLGAAPRNITPPANVANRDRYDDGVNLGAIGFQNCQNATFQVRVFISPGGQTALLNAGIDTAYVPLEQIGMDVIGQFADADDFVIHALFKLYPWEHLFTDAYGAKVPA
ncbi:MAG: DNRLRE domain-containing protein, partial [Caldilineae bacterium]